MKQIPEIAFDIVISKRDWFHDVSWDKAFKTLPLESEITPYEFNLGREMKSHMDEIEQRKKGLEGRWPHISTDKLKDGVDRAVAYLNKLNASVRDSDAANDKDKEVKEHKSPKQGD